MIIHFIDLRRTIIDKLTIYFKYEPNGKIIEVIVKNTKDKIKSIF